jgi:cell wall-associated NlpC family hydrolase
LFKQKFAPSVIAACFVLSLSATAFAQSPENDSRHLTAATDSSNIKPLQPEPVASTPTATAMGEERPLRVVGERAAAPRFEQVLMSAIQERLGSNYRWGSTGPNTFDCSGFVWSSFQEAGIKFDRESARGLFSRFAPATKAEESKFGTLVFFSGLTHVGIVADEHGFYHASRHNGVVYAPFNDYWLSRIDGFRRVPLNQAPTTLSSEKTKGGKPAANGASASPTNGGGGR